MEKKEKVLCVKRKSLPQGWIKKRSVSKIDENIFYNACAESDFAWKDRSRVEMDPSYKQIIPYIVIQTRDILKTAIYRRKGSEKRLHDLWSMGLGGHINPVDDIDFQPGDTRNMPGEARSIPGISCVEELDKASNNTCGNSPDVLKKIIYSGMMRELYEELAGRPPNLKPLFKGVINEEETDVGQVHLGVVFQILTDCPELFVPGEELVGFQWQNTVKLGRFHMEIWSQLCLKLFERQKKMNPKSNLC